MRFTLVWVALLVLALAWIWPGHLTKYPAGILVPDEPEQSATLAGKSWQLKGYTIRALADYIAGLH